MAVALKRSHGILARTLNKRERVALRSHSNGHSFGRWSESRKRRLTVSLGVLAGAAATCGSVMYFLDSSVKAAVEQAKSPNYPWKFDGWFTSLDHAAIRRGWQVYKAVCSTCHSLQYVPFRELIDVSHTREEVVAIAAEYEVEDGPDEEGNYYMRPCKVTDKIPPPFPNEEAARYANNGAHPPDLSYIVYARQNGHNYLFALLTGFMDPPAGVSLTDTQYFNPYYPGGALSMNAMFQDGAIDYEDGTVAVRSQMAKDIVEFLYWVGGQEHDDRKRMMITVIGIGTILAFSVFCMKKRAWSTMTSTRLYFLPRDKCK